MSDRAGKFLLSIISFVGGGLGSAVVIGIAFGTLSQRVEVSAANIKKHDEELNTVRQLYGELSSIRATLTYVQEDLRDIKQEMRKK